MISLPSYIFMKNQLHIGMKDDLSFNLRHFWPIKSFRGPRFYRKTDCFFKISDAIHRYIFRIVSISEYGIQLKESIMQNAKKIPNSVSPFCSYYTCLSNFPVKKLIIKKFFKEVTLKAFVVTPKMQRI